MQKSYLYNTKLSYEQQFIACSVLDHITVPTEIALLNVTTGIRQNTDLKHVTLLLLFGFAKAFDAANHNLLCTKLHSNFNFSSLAVLTN